MNIPYLKGYTKECIINHPTIADEIYDIYMLAISEIEEGGSESHEVGLAINDIKYLIEENLIKTN